MAQKKMQKINVKVIYTINIGGHKIKIESFRSLILTPEENKQLWSFIEILYKKMGEEKE